MNSNYISILNAIPTAEGIISYLIQNRITTIANSNILIIGYGRCGKVLADKLLSLGAKIFVNTLNKSDYAIAITHKIIPNPQINFRQKNFDIIINTAPAQTISDEDLKLLSDETLLIDITSVGFDIDIAQKKNAKSARLLSIPAKFALQTAGEILGEYIYKKVLKCSQEKKIGFGITGSFCSINNIFELIEQLQNDGAEIFVLSRQMFLTWTTDLTMQTNS